MEIRINHDKENQKFFAIVEKQEAKTAYREKGGRLDFYHTYVPPEYRHRGVAAKIVRYALNYARDNNLKITASCPYVRIFISENKEFQELLE